MKRSGGVLMHISSLASPYGIGTMGKEARDFADFLKEAGQSYWQILPVVPTGYGDSPYSSFSTFAGNPYLIDLDQLKDEGLLKEEEYASINWGENPEQVDFGILFLQRAKVLKKACTRFLAEPHSEFEQFRKENDWLEPYALFMTLKGIFGGQPWTKWPEEYRRRDPKVLAGIEEQHREEILTHEVMQFFFFSQWKALKAYVNAQGIRIIGDLPIYVASDSADVWQSPEQFQMDENLTMTEVAGCPPDPFAAGGQLWGNPLYDWEAMKADGYSWWIRRMRHVLDTYDVVRIDHFRGFAGYYAIPGDATDARNGRWREGPGIDLFRKIEETLGKREIIAEDLGFVDESVKSLLEQTGFPGMKLIEFAFDSRDGGDYFPHNYPKNCVVYTGTHDNAPVMGWFTQICKEDAEQAVEYLNLTEEEGLSWGMMRGAWSSVADLAVVQAQDLLSLGLASRMNTPSTSEGNWRWRAKKGVFTKELAAKLKHQMELYQRLRG